MYPFEEGGDAVETQVVFRVTPWGIHCVRQTALMYVGRYPLQDVNDVRPKCIVFSKKRSDLSPVGSC